MTKETEIQQTFFEHSISAALETYLWFFIEMALPPEEIIYEDYSEENFAGIKPRYPKKIKREDSLLFSEEAELKDLDYRNVIIDFSKFVYSFSSLDPNAGNNLSRISRSTITNQGIKVHSDQTLLIAYTLQGEGEFILSDKEKLISKEYDAYIFDCSYPVELIPLSEEPWDSAFIRIQRGMQSEYFEEMKAFLERNRFVKLVYGAGTRFRSLVWQLLSHRTSQGIHSEKHYNLLLMALFLELEMSVLYSETQNRSIPSFVNKMKSYIDHHYMEELPLDFLAQKFNVSKYHMSREFKKHTGISPNDYIIDRRINHAKELLLETDQAIARIAEKVGINNPNHFLYLFKNKEGMTPSAFRKKSSHF